MDKINKSTLLGLILIVIGILLSLGNIRIIPWYVRDYLFQWENILIVAGAFLLITKENQKLGGILLAVGLFFGFDNWFRISIWDLWPLALVGVGIYIIRRRSVDSDIVTSDEDLTDTIEDTAIFSGGDKVFSNQNFRGGELTAIFGGSNVDLTTARLSKDSARLEVLYVFGGSKIRVPKEWNVEIKVTSIFGGLSDKRAITDINPDAPEKLVINGLILFGGAEIAN